MVQNRNVLRPQKHSDQATQCWRSLCLVMKRYYTNIYKYLQLVWQQIIILPNTPHEWEMSLLHALIFIIRYICETYIITFLFYKIHIQPNTPHGGRMSPLHWYLQSDIYLRFTLLHFYSIKYIPSQIPLMEEGCLYCTNIYNQIYT